MWRLQVVVVGDVACACVIGSDLVAVIWWRGVVNGSDVAYAGIVGNDLNTGGGSNVAVVVGCDVVVVSRQAAPIWPKRGQSLGCLMAAVVATCWWWWWQLTWWDLKENTKMFINKQTYLVT
jgi:hypothetical protein